MQRRGAGAARAAAEWPAHFVAFDLLRLSGTDTTLCPYRRRRAALESLFTARRLSAPWALCPSTTDPDTVHEWLTWAAVDMEGVVYKRLDSRYEPSVRGWRKYKVLETTEAIVGAVTGALVSPRSLPLGRYDDRGRLQYTGRTTTLAQKASSTLAGLLAADPARTSVDGLVVRCRVGYRGDAGRHARAPERVVEVSVDVARDAASRWRHPARLHRPAPTSPPPTSPS